MLVKVYSKCPLDHKMSFTTKFTFVETITHSYAIHNFFVVIQSSGDSISNIVLRYRPLTCFDGLLSDGFLLEHFKISF